MTQRTKPPALDKMDIVCVKYRLKSRWEFDPVPIADYWWSELQDKLDDYKNGDPAHGGGQIPTGHPTDQATRGDDLKKSGKIVIPAGFEFDGASIPDWIEKWIPKFLFKFAPHDPRLNPPALVHDWLYTNHQVQRHMAGRSIFII